MNQFFVMAILSGVALSQGPVISAQQEQPADSKHTSTAETLPSDLPALPPAPKGKSTIIGGEIRSVDPVRDQFLLNVFGRGQMKILFDERTQVYRDGEKIPLRDLRDEGHASVQTALDGTNVFAVSIHILSQSPQGECQGHVLNYNLETGQLTVSSSLSPEPVRLLVAPGTPIVRAGQSTFTAARSGPSDLVRGTLVSANFQSDKQGRGVASEITILAVPGSTFAFGGNLVSLDLHSGLLVLLDPSDQKSYQIFFDSVCVPAIRNLHPGEDIGVTAVYDGAHYVARDVTRRSFQEPADKIDMR
jgi:hypothetical protein